MSETKLNEKDPLNARMKGKTFFMIPAVFSLLFAAASFAGIYSATQSLLASIVFPFVLFGILPRVPSQIQSLRAKVHNECLTSIEKMENSLTLRSVESHWKVEKVDGLRYLRMQSWYLHTITADIEQKLDALNGKKIEVLWRLQAIPGDVPESLRLEVVDVREVEEEESA